MVVRPQTRRRVMALGFLAALVVLTWKSWAQAPLLPDFPKPKPDLANIRYGPHERHVLDLWTAKSRAGKAAPAPLIVFFHGGAFRLGDKSSVPGWLVVRCLSEGISVASANYRLSDTAAFPGPMLDGARAIQYLRSRAKEFGIDPARIGASGSSAGAGIASGSASTTTSPTPGAPTRSPARAPGSLAWASTAPRRRMTPGSSSRSSAAARHEHSALKQFYGLADSELDSPRAHKLYEAASPINFATADDPPVILFYAEPDGPLPADAKPGQGIHHPRFGAALKAKLDPMGVECLVRHSKDFPKHEDPREREFREMTEFFARQLMSRDSKP